MKIGRFRGEADEEQVAWNRGKQEKERERSVGVVGRGNMIMTQNSGSEGSRRVYKC